MKHKLILLTVPQMEISELRKIGNFLNSVFPKIPKIVDLGSKKISLKSTTISFKEVNELKDVLNLSEKEWEIFKKSIEARLENNFPPIALTFEKCFKKT